LKQRGVAFEERMVDDRDDWVEEVLRISNQNTVPVFVHPDGRIEVGWEGEYG
jgi:glutathione S-transferase